MIVITTPNSVNKANRVLPKSAQWCYFGKDALIRKTVAVSLKEKERFFLRDRIYNTAIRTQQQFLDFMSILGSKQKDRLTWWASKFASRSPLQTDIFLFLCYKEIINQLIDGCLNKRNSDNNLIIVIEDPWFYTLVKKLNIAGHNNNLIFLGRVNLWGTKSIFLIKGFALRLYALTRLIAAWVLIKVLYKPSAPVKFKNSVPCVAIFCSGEKRAFRNGVLIDHYMSGLSSLLKSKGIPFFYIYSLVFPISTVWNVCNNKDNLWPLIKNISFLQLIKRFLMLWGIQEGVRDLEPSLRILLEREKWWEFLSVDFNSNLVLFDALNEFFSKKWCQSVIFTFENQSWEKILSLSSYKKQIKVVGYQHSSIWRLFSSQFLGKDDLGLMPLPDKIITSGSHFACLYREGGIPEEKIVIGGSWRYSHLFKYTHIKKENINPIALIILPSDIWAARSLIEEINKALAEKRIKENVEFWIKYHPDTPLNRIYPHKTIALPYKTKNKDLKDLFKEVDFIITTSSTSGLEAYLCGKRVISYVPDNLLSADPLSDISDNRIHKWHEGETLELDLYNNPPEVIEQSLVRDFYSEIDTEVWLNCLSDKLI